MWGADIKLTFLEEIGLLALFHQGGFGLFALPQQFLLSSSLLLGLLS